MGLVALVVAILVAGCGGEPIEGAQGEVAAVSASCPAVPMDALQCGAPGMTPVDASGAQLVICTAHDGTSAVDCNLAGADGTPGAGGHCVAACPDGLITGAPFACQPGQQEAVTTDCGVLDAYGARVFACTMAWGRECTGPSGIHCVTTCPVR